MRSTVVPAQVTTVEDRIMGSLGFSQLALIVIPVFVSAGMFIVLPPVMHGSVYKYVLSVIFAVLMGILAIRINGKIVLLWLITILRFNHRPKYYLFNKNTQAFRDDHKLSKQTLSEEESIPVERDTVQVPRLAFQDTARVLQAIGNRDSKLRFETTKKGGLRVRFSQIKD